MSAPFLLQLWGKFQDENEKRYLTSVFTKTQFAGVETHKVLIHLLRYISSKYFEKFDLVYESGYWESEDEELVEEKFREMNDLLDLFASGLETIPRKTGETLEDFIIRIANKIHKDKK